jgi:tRNA(Glu) U13 pseudouridine synthase TruD
MRRPQPSSEPEALEEEVLRSAGLTREVFEGFRKLAPGARRPLLVGAEGLTLSPLEDAGTLRVEVTLPSGTYATVLLEELTHTPPEAMRLQAASGGQLARSGLPREPT